MRIFSGNNLAVNKLCSHHLATMPTTYNREIKKMNKRYRLFFLLHVRHEMFYDNVPTGDK